jgi:hypothetical protein
MRPSASMSVSKGTVEDQDYLRWPHPELPALCSYASAESCLLEYFHKTSVNAATTVKSYLTEFRPSPRRKMHLVNIYE